MVLIAKDLNSCKSPWSNVGYSRFFVSKMTFPSLRNFPSVCLSYYIANWYGHRFETALVPCLCMMKKSLPCIGKNVKYMCHLNIDKWCEMQIYFHFSVNHSVREVSSNSITAMLCGADRHPVCLETIDKICTLLRTMTLPWRDKWNPPMLEQHFHDETNGIRSCFSNISTMEQMESARAWATFSRWNKWNPPVLEQHFHDGTNGIRPCLSRDLPVHVKMNPRVYFRITLPRRSLPHSILIPLILMAFLLPLYTYHRLDLASEQGGVIKRNREYTCTFIMSCFRSGVTIPLHKQIFMPVVTPRLNIYFVISSGTNQS